MRELTRAEEQVMQVLWKIKKGFVKDILEHFDEPKPAYNTVSTIVRIFRIKDLLIIKLTEGHMNISGCFKKRLLENASQHFCKRLFLKFI